jgi:hypothetical protein
MIRVGRRLRHDTLARRTSRSTALIKFMVVALGSGLPAYLVFQALQDQELMIRFWGTLIAYAIGWYASRSFVRNHLDL